MIPVSKIVLIGQFCVVVCLVCLCVTL